jgi:uncharacterized membrane protein
VSRFANLLIRLVFALLVLLSVTATTMRVLAPDYLIARVERVRARAIVALGVSQPAPERRAEAVAEADAKFAENRTVTRLHVLSGAAFLALAALQLTQRVRRRTPRTHRIAGRVAIVLAWASGLTGLFFGLWQPLAGLAEQVIVGVVGLFLLASVSLAFRHIRAGRVGAHREWMLRGIAAALAIASVRLVAIPLDLVLTPRGVDVRVVFALSLWIGWAITMVGAEWWIRATRARVPSAIQVAA